MRDAHLTHHAARRIRQRGIPDEILPLLMQFGAHEYDKRGSRLVYLTPRGRQRIRDAVGKERYSRLERSLDVYAVIDTDDVVVTIGHRTQRIRRN